MFVVRKIILPTCRMAITQLSIQDCMNQTAQAAMIIDVRSPSEFNHAHIPSAFNLPLFDDEERKIVGTIYKQKSRQQAIKAGLEFFGGKMKPMIEEVEKQLNLIHPTSKNKSVNLFVHCWRGGMRSAGVAWLLDLYGYKVFTLKGGYKAYRNFVLQSFEQKYSLKIISGRTGSGKTLVIKKLQSQNISAIDLESLAHHKGSAFGALGQLQQPTQEQFENNLATQLLAFPAATIFLEDESQRIGNVNIPSAFWQQMRNCKIYFCDFPFEERLKLILKEYGDFQKNELIAATIRIQKKLGGLICKIILQHFEENDMKAAFSLLLEYYDREYDKAFQRKEKPFDQQFFFKKLDVDEIAQTIIQS